MKTAVLCALLFCLMTRAAVAEDVSLVLATVGVGGKHFVVVKTDGTAVVHTTPKGQAQVDHTFPYDADRARTLWAEIDRLAKDGLVSPTPKDNAFINASENYLVVLKGADGAKQSLLFSRCARNPRIDDVMKRLTDGLLSPESMALPADSCKTARRPLAAELPALCDALQKQGWLPAADPFKPNGGGLGEINIQGVAYMCMLERTLPGRGPGHAPTLSALISDVEGPSVVFSLNIWCESDRRAALDALSNAIDRGLAGIALHAPAPLLDAVRTAQTTRSAGGAAGLAFHTESNSIDAQACSRVRDGQLGAILMGFSAVVEFAAKAPGR